MDIPRQNLAKIFCGSGEEVDFVAFASKVAILDIRPYPFFTILRPWSQIMLHVKFENCRSGSFIEEDV